MTSKKKHAKPAKPTPKPKAKAAPHAPVKSIPAKTAPAKTVPPKSPGINPAVLAAKVPGKPPVKKSDINFKVGDHVVYPTHGVGLIKEIRIQEIAGHRLELFIIAFERDRMTLKVPLVKLATSGLRKLSSRKIMEVALTTLKGRARIKRTMWSRRAQEYEAKINSGDPVAIAEVVRDLHRNVGQPDQSFSERQIYEAARDRLAAELAAVERTDLTLATQKLETLLEAA